MKSLQMSLVTGLTLKMMICSTIDAIHAVADPVLPRRGGAMVAWSSLRHRIIFLRRHAKSLARPQLGHGLQVSLKTQ